MRSMWLGLGGVAGRDLGDPHDHLHDVADLDVGAHDAGLLGAGEERRARRPQRGAVHLEQLGVLIQVVDSSAASARSVAT